MENTDDKDRSSGSATPARGHVRDRRPLGWDDLKILVLFLCFVLAIEGIAAGLWSYSVDGAAVDTGGKPLSGWGVFATWTICSGAASLVGGLLGFLFGIPRSVEQAAGRGRPNRVGTTPEAATAAAVAAGAPDANLPAAATAGPLLRVNTNLEDISDFITKALLGAGLAQAGALIAGAGHLATFLGPSFGPGRTGQAVAIATIIYGVLEGFFAGYLATRLYLTAAFERHDPQGGPPA